MITLRHLHVEGFKSIRTLDLDLRSLNVLVGANGSGKSNLLAFFQLLNAIADRRLQQYTAVAGADSFLYFGREHTPEMRIRLTFSDAQQDYPSDVYAASLISNDQDKLVIQREVYFSNTHVDQPFRLPPEVRELLGNDAPAHSFTSFVPASTTESLIVSRLNDDENAHRIHEMLLSCKLYHFENTASNARVKGLGELADGGVLADDARNLAAFLYVMRLRYRPYYDRLLPVIRSVVPFFNDFVLEPYAPNPDKIRLRWRHKGSPEVFSAHALSDGTLRFICLATLLLQPKLPPVIILDEPELGLHPHAVDMLASLLKSAATRIQVIVATQSVTLIDQMDFENVLIAERVGNESQFHWLDSDEHLKAWLADYTLGQIWQMNLYGGTTPAALETQA